MFYDLVARMIPRSMLKKIVELLNYSDIQIRPEKFIGFVISFSLGVAATVAFNLNLVLGLPFIPIFAIVFVLGPMIVYVWLILSTDAKGKFIESVFPDALQLMASNIKVGLTVDRALILSAGSEFGPLEKEIKKMGKEVITGKDLEDALMDTTKRIKSSMYKKTIMLIVDGIKYGGKLSDLLEQTSADLSNQRMIQKEINSKVMMYVMFLFIVIGIGAPVLFGVSSFLVNMLVQQSSSGDLPEIDDNMMMQSSSIPTLSASGIDIDPSFVKWYAIASLITSSIFGGLIIGLIRGGKEKDGLQYIPLLLLMSMGIFFIIRMVLDKFLGGMM